MSGSNNFGALDAGTRLRCAASWDYYIIDCVLGEGGFGITYKATEFAPTTGSGDREMGAVAVKEYFPMHCATRSEDGITVVPIPGREEEYAAGLTRFSEEMKTLASLRNVDSVVRVVNTFNANGTAYLVMEYLDGVPLYKKAQELGGRIPPEELLPKLPRLLQDISQMHRAGILHRDITPDNIMWMPDGTLKLIDFGSARSMSKSHKTVLLKLGYAPIEQYITSGQGTWTDVYALCATIYYLLSGGNPPDAVDRLDNDPLKPLVELGVALTPWEDAAILHGMTVQPMDRTQTADDLLRELSPAYAEVASKVRRPSFFRRLLDRLLRRGRA